MDVPYVEMVSFTTWSLYPAKESAYLLHMTTCVPQIGSEHGGEKEIPACD